MIVWAVGTGSTGDQRLHGYDGDTGAVIYAGGGANELMAGTHSYSTTGIVASGRIYVAGDNKVYVFKLPAVPTPPSNLVATVVSSSQINLSWQDNSDNEQTFQVFRTTSGRFRKIAVVGANVTFYSDVALSPNTTYHYKVRAHNRSGNSAFSNIVSATTTP